MARRYAEDPIAYRIAFSRVTQTLHLATEPGREGMPSTSICEAIEALVGSEPLAQGQEALAHDAMDKALDLIESTQEELIRLGWLWVGWAPSRRRRKRAIKRRVGLPSIFRRGRRKKRMEESWDLGRFLAEEIEPMVVVLYFSARVCAEGYDSSLLLAEKSSLPIGREGVDLDRAKRRPAPWLRSYLGYLMVEPPKKGRKRPGWLGWKRREEVDFGVRYNLACLYSRLGEKARDEQSERGRRAFGHAAEQLRRSITAAGREAGVSLAQQASRDPALKYLQQYEPDRFEAAISDLPGDADLI